MVKKESLFAKYIKERENKHILETEKGFATYLFESDYVYLEDIYVLPEYREKKECFKMADKVAKIAKEAGFKRMLGSVSPTAPGSTISLKVLLEYGFSVASSKENIIYFIKDI